VSRVRGRATLARLQRSGAIPNHDYLLNHLVNRIPLADARMRTYAALGVRFDDVASATIALGVELWAASGLAIGYRSTIGQRCYIDARAGVRIDDDVSVSRGVTVLTATHVVDDPDFGATLAPVHIERHAWIAVRALVLPGIRIGEGAVVAAGAVVTADVEPYTVVAGTPAKAIRTRLGPLSYQLDWRPSWH
jgi:putative colanic acid biosynthesis acetyltransferase WcaF